MNASEYSFFARSFPFALLGATIAALVSPSSFHGADPWSIAALGPASILLYIHVGSFSGVGWIGPLLWYVVEAGVFLAGVAFSVRFRFNVLLSAMALTLLWFVLGFSAFVPSV